MSRFTAVWSWPPLRAEAERLPHRSPPVDGGNNTDGERSRTGYPATRQCPGLHSIKTLQRAGTPSGAKDIRRAWAAPDHQLELVGFARGACSSQARKRVKEICLNDLLLTLDPQVGHGLDDAALG